MPCDIAAHAAHLSRLVNDTQCLSVIMSPIQSEVQQAR